MKKINLKLFMLLFISISIIFSSCKKDIGEFLNEQFPEPNNMSNDILINGQVAAPLVDTKLTLRNFIPSTDSSLWAEVDSNDLVHLRMYFKNVLDLKASDIYGLPIVGVVPADSATIKTDTNKLKIYDNVLSGHLFFNDPRFTFIIKNEIPITTFIRFDSIVLYKDGEVFLAARDENKHYIDAPTQPGEIKKTSILVDKNSIPDFEQFFSPIPKFTSFQITAGSDQNQTVPASYGGALTGNEKIKVDVDIDLPLDAHLVDFVMGDTIPFVVDSIKNIEQIKSVTFKMILDNEFPVGGKIQASFVDTNNNGGIDDTIMTLFDGDGWDFQTAITDPNGVTTSSVVSEMIVTLTQEQLDRLKKYHASKILISAKFNSYQSQTGQDIKIFGRYQLGVKMGIKVDYSGNTSDIPQ